MSFKYCDVGSMEDLSKIYQKNMNEFMYQCLSEELGGIDIPVLKTMCWGYAPTVYFKTRTSYEGWWTYPERDIYGDTVTIGLRKLKRHCKSSKSNKCMHPDGNGRGLTYAT